uniref:C2H2-type domain-containing protein n=1 Tax=Strigamia maritima TaxID=126957 RepID=T1IPM5_STRMM
MILCGVSGNFMKQDTLSAASSHWFSSWSITHPVHLDVQLLFLFEPPVMQCLEDGVYKCTVDSILATVIATEVEEPPCKRMKNNPARDFSMFRTPSGKYYCSTCNITLNSESQFSQHFDSKKHKAKMNTHKYETCHQI